jgi:hypothetical protein
MHMSIHRMLGSNSKTASAILGCSRTFARPASANAWPDDSRHFVECPDAGGRWSISSRDERGQITGFTYDLLQIFTARKLPG